MASHQPKKNWDSQQHLPPASDGTRGLSGDQIWRGGGDDLRLPANSQRTWRDDRRNCDNLQ
jgi:hypothetical protein